ncbi:MAG: NUDIX hydrolase [Clostridia bacterium]|nr:NUDIX hydrolase [Clostridia bacterium]
MSDFIEKTLDDQLIYDGAVVKLHKYTVALPNGKTAYREIVRHPGAVCVLPLTDDNEVICVRQFRFPFGRVLTELPAGKLDSPDEDPLEAARRELREETGAIAGKMTYLGDLYPSVAIFDENIRMYLATELSFGQTDPDDDEFLDILRIPLDELVAQILRGEITDAKTQTAVLKVAAMQK